MPDSHPTASAWPWDDHLPLPSRGFNSPRRVASTSLYKAGFLLGSGEGPRKKRNPWSPAGGGSASSPSGEGNKLLGCTGWSLGCRMLNVHATRKRYMQEMRLERVGGEHFLSPSSSAQGSDPPWASLFCPGAEKTISVSQGGLSAPQPPTHFFLRILGFFTGRR